MSDFNGLNGTIMLNTTRGGIGAGTIAGEAYGYKRRLRVTLDVRIERLERQATYQTTEHYTVSAPLALSVQTGVWRPDGQDVISGGPTVEPLRAVARLGRPSPLLTSAALLELADIADRWHLNEMRAGCAHQTVVWEDEPYHRPSLTQTQPCPVSGYRYGSAWLVEPLPTDVLTRLLALLAGPIGNETVYVHPSLTHTPGGHA